jgi:hypothetical protein
LTKEQFLSLPVGTIVRNLGALPDAKVIEQDGERRLQFAPFTANAVTASMDCSEEALADVEVKFPYRVRIMWGSTGIDPREPVEYEFATNEELNAFLLGVDEAAGWLDYTQIDPNPDGSWPSVEGIDEMGSGSVI